MTLADPVCPIVSNHDGQPYSDGAGWSERLVDHVIRPVRWRTSLESLAGMGASGLLEVGHGSMIAGLAKRTVPDLQRAGVSTPSDLAVLA